MEFRAIVSATGQARGAERGSETRQVILDTAERMFVEKGYSGVTLRDLTAAAGVNLASVNYHFGSKDALLLEVFRRGSIAINRARLKLLHEVEESEAPPDVRAVLRALFAPPLRATLTIDSTGNEGRSIYMQFVARAVLDGPPQMREMIETDVGHLHRFVDALAVAVPHLDRTELLWRFHFAMGSLHSMYTNMRRLDALSGGSVEIGDVEAVIDRLVEFCAAGLEAPQAGAPAQPV